MRHIFTDFQNVKYGIDRFIAPPQTTIYCCLEESIQDRSGTYYSDCKEKTPSRAARSDKKAKKLWEMSEKLVGLNPEK